MESEVVPLYPRSVEAGMRANGWEERWTRTGQAGIFPKADQSDRLASHRFNESTDVQKLRADKLQAMQVICWSSPGQ